MQIITKRTQLADLINEYKLKRGVEVGVAKGEFSEYLLSNSSLDALYSIDAWTDDLEAMRAYRRSSDVKRVDNYYEETINRLKKFGDRSIVIKDISENAVEKFENNSLDFIYLDASHLFSGFAIDLIKWWEKLKTNGIFAGHDYMRKRTYQVSYALNGFCMEHKQFFYLTTEDNGKHQTPSPSWWLIKTERDRNTWTNEFPKYCEIIRAQAKELNRNTQVDIPYECH